MHQEQRFVLLKKLANIYKMWKNFFYLLARNSMIPSVQTRFFIFIIVAKKITIMNLRKKKTLKNRLVGSVIHVQDKWPIQKQQVLSWGLGYGTEVHVSLFIHWKSPKCTLWSLGYE